MMPPAADCRVQEVHLNKADQQAGQSHEHQRQHQEGREVAAQDREQLLNDPPDIERAGRIAHRRHGIAPDCPVALPSS
jgi:hypothetical protein